MTAEIEDGKSSLFSEFVYCHDCKAKMHYCTTGYFEKRQDHFICSNYRSNTGTGSTHFIRAVVLEEMVWMHMSAVISYVAHHEGYFRRWMESRLKMQSAGTLKLLKKQLSQVEKRITKLDRLYITRFMRTTPAGGLLMSISP